MMHTAKLGGVSSAVSSVPQIKSISLHRPSKAFTPVKAQRFTGPPTTATPLRKRFSTIIRAQSASEAAAAPTAGFVPVLKPEDLPKGVRKEVRIQGKSVLLFWYRNQIYAIEARSPAEGAYSEGFIQAKFTQDGCIECPATGTLFSLNDGSIVSWYPNNMVLRMLTPLSTCRPMEIYPVKLTQDAICVDVSLSTTTGASANTTPTKGGSDTSLENNNVYGLEPKVYVEGAGTVEGDGESVASKVATVGVGVFATTACLGVAYAVFLYISQ